MMNKKILKLKKFTARHLPGCRGLDTPLKSIKLNFYTDNNNELSFNLNFKTKLIYLMILMEFIINLPPLQNPGSALGCKVLKNLDRA